MRLLRVLSIFTAVAVFLCGCSAQRETWKIVYNASPQAMDAAIHSDATFPYIWDAAENTVPEIDPPVHLRPCCAFGMDMKTSFRGIPIPFVKVSNIVETSDIGVHTYDAGLVGHGTDRDEIKDNEENGVIYTCRAGFVDLAHIRDYSDWTIYLAFWIHNHLGEDLEMQLPPELGPRKILIHSFDPSGLSRQQKVILAVSMAQWAAIRLSAWHEIAQWHGHGLKAFPEYPSAYSVEDLYSNILGAKIAAAIIYSGGSKSDQLYSRNFDQWLKNILEHLGAQPIEVSRAYMKAVDQHWWDSNERLPNKYIVLKRNYDLGHIQQPVIPPSILRDKVDASSKADCESDEPIVLSLVDRIYGFKMKDLVSMHITIDDEFHPVFAYPSPEHEKSRLITDDDFAAIAAANAAVDKQELDTRKAVAAHGDHSNEP